MWKIADNSDLLTQFTDFRADDEKIGGVIVIRHSAQIENELLHGAIIDQLSDDFWIACSSSLIAILQVDAAHDGCFVHLLVTQKPTR